MPTRELSDACSSLREAVPQIIDKWNSRYSHLGLRAGVGDVLRTVDEQKAAYAKGRTVMGPKPDEAHPMGHTVTHADGVTNLSNHQQQNIHGENCSHAVDMIVLADDGKRYVDDERWYRALIGLSICQGVRSGGDWDRPDFPHLACPFSNE